MDRSARNQSIYSLLLDLKAHNQSIYSLFWDLKVHDELLEFLAGDRGYSVGGGGAAAVVTVPAGGGGVPTTLAIWAGALFHDAQNPTTIREASGPHTED